MARSCRGSPWFTTSCSTSGARSASSRRSATRGPTRTSSPPSTTRRAPRDASPHRDPQASFLQKLRPTSRTFRPLLPLYPHAVESLDLRGYDIVVSSSSAWAHGVLVDPGAVHVCYCHNPFRYAWSEREATLAAPQPADPAGAAACCSRAGASGTGSRRSGSIATSPTRRSRRSGSGATSGASRRSCTRPWSSRASRRGRSATHYLVAGRADAAQAHRRRRPGLQRAAAAARGRGGRAGVPASEAPRRPDRAADGPALRRRGRRSAADLAGARGHRRGGVRDRRGRVAGERAAGDRVCVPAASWRPSTRARTGAFYENGDDPRDLAAAVAGFDVAVWTPIACVTSAQRFSVDRFQDRLRAIVDETVANDGTPRKVDRPVGGLFAAEIVTPRRGIHEDPLNPSPRGHNHRNPVASFGLSVVRGPRPARLISAQRSQA